ncbi:rhomboid family intramembrane serine protease [Neptuniibacter sp. QD72_48]|uniref:rhomboid family intramembrane serine protease n=1 Tax=unclassified Neptuniibacter TaxID=2630693 RepID=UPI0039F485AA
MVIIPTEKKFDWRRPPFVLFLLVILNALVFFFAQDKDEEMINDALNRYTELQYFDAEWDMYLNYLKEDGVADKQIVEYQNLHRSGNTLELSYYLLSDLNFFEYLRYNQVRFDEPGSGDYWLNRSELYDLISSTTIFGHGLKPKAFSPLDLVTYQFLHGNFFHLIGNIFFLVIFGFAVEAAIGHLRFLLFYLLGGIAGGVLFLLVNSQSPSALVGASGSISAVMAMYLGVFRFRKIEFFYWFFIFVGFMRAPALWVLGLYIANELYQFATVTDSNVAFMAHTGGFIAGALLIFTTIMVSPKVLDEEYLEKKEDLAEDVKARDKIYHLLGKFSFKTAISAIDEFEEKYGSDFELRRVKYEILKAQHNDDYRSVALQLLTYEKPTAEELDKIEELWHCSTFAQEELKNDDLLQLAWKMATLSSLKTSEEIFTMLYSRGMKTEEFSHLARKLSVAFGEREHEVKCKRYATAADEIYERSRRGLFN